MNTWSCEMRDRVTGVAVLGGQYLLEHDLRSRQIRVLWRANSKTLSEENAAPSVAAVLQRDLQSQVWRSDGSSDREMAFEIASTPRQEPVGYLRVGSLRSFQLFACVLD